MSGAEAALFGHDRRRWVFFGGGGVLVFAAGIAGLKLAAGVDAAARWALVVAPLLCYEVWFYHSRRSALGEDGHPIRAADAVTVIRGWLYAATAGFLLVPRTAGVVWVPALCYGAGVVLDHVDGRIARRTGGGTRLGERLDMAFDTLGFLVAPAVAVVWGALPVWYLLLSGARYLFKGARGLRRWRGRPVHPLPDSAWRRRLSGVHMVVIAVALVPAVPAGPVAAVAAVALALSLSVFARDYLAVTGVLATDAGQ
jgi:CDP-diacylglycerol--glycerol-3-phosphate 3-phosphatidyltransferase